MCALAVTPGPRGNRRSTGPSRVRRALENGALENGALENGALENGALENGALENGVLGKRIPGRRTRAGVRLLPGHRRRGDRSPRGLF